MEYQIIGQDPLKILSSTAEVLKSAQSVELDPSSLVRVVKEVFTNQNLAGVCNDFAFTKKLEDNLQLAFIANAINYCFWSPLGEKSWEVEYPRNNFIKGGWYGLVACFQRALEEGFPLLSADYLAQINLGDIKRIFRSTNSYPLFLLEEREKCLQEVGRELVLKYEGSVLKLLEKSRGDAIKLIKLVLKDFSYFKDISYLEGKRIFFFKRAQIVASDWDYILRAYNKKALKNLDQVTAFADYRLPQVLNNLGLLKYAFKLKEKIAQGTEIISGSREEIEIRAGTIWAVELIKRKLDFKLEANAIDCGLWLYSQKNKLKVNFHRTKTIFY